MTTVLRQLCALLLSFALAVGPCIAAVGSWNGVAFTAWNGVAQTSWNGTAISCAGGGETLLYDSFSSGTSTFSVGRASTSTFCGMNNFVPTASSTVTRMEFKMSAVWSVPATMNSKTFTAGMWTIASTYNNNSAVGTSDTVNAVYTWSGQVVSFPFSTPFSITSGTPYNVSVQATAAVDSGNYLDMTYTNPGVITGALDQFNASGVSQFTNTFGGSPGSNINIQVRIYGTTP